MKRSLVWTICAVLAFVLLHVPSLAFSATYTGAPTNYRQLLSALAPGDQLLLEPGIYRDGLPIINVNGELGRPIAIVGPEQGPRSVFIGRWGANTIQIRNSSYVEIKNLELDGQRRDGDAVYADGQWVHDITLENLYIHGHDLDQSIVGISTKAPAWNWTIRGCVITGAGTGMYLGNSDGTAPFLAGTIEYNLIVNTVGYNVQIKHQKPRRLIQGMPPGPNVTRIRHNVFSKAQRAATGANARPNLLVGHWPLSGEGRSDRYEIYGNFFYDNPTEALFQGEGNFALYSNLFVNNFGSAIAIQPHNDRPRNVVVFNNTVVARDRGIRISGGAVGYIEKVIANAVFAGEPINATTQEQNITGTQAAAAEYLAQPTGPTGILDLYPRSGKLRGLPYDTSFMRLFSHGDLDFNGLRHAGVVRGAYAGEGSNPGWFPKLERKPQVQILLP